MMVVDTGAMLALLDASDEHHLVVKELYEENVAGWILPSVILPEVDYLVAKYLGAKAQDAFIADNLNPPLPVRRCANSGLLSYSVEHNSPGRVQLLEKIKIANIPC